MNRVVITGLGVVTPLGNSASELSAALKAGRSAIGPVTQIANPDLGPKVGAEVRGFDPLAHFPENKLSLLDRSSQMALVAARDAVKQSGLDFKSNGLGLRSACIIGTGVGGMTTLDDNFQNLYGKGARRVHPFTIPKMMINAPGAHITMEHGIQGPSFTVASACASANHAMGVAFQMLRSGAIQAAVTGGAECVFTYGTLKGWEALRVMAPDTCRPFSKDRRGMVLGEGAAMFVLEERGAAQARGAEILGEIIGFGMSSDASDIVLPSAEGAARAIASCLEDARIRPDAVQYVNAHGTGTAANDSTETKALHTVFGEHAKKLMVSSTKSMHGHALGGAAAIELAATIAALRDGFVPPTANYNEPDPQCDLDYVPNEARDAKAEVAISNSFAFGGHNAVIAVRR
ncbi:MAG: beta-ketoacyl-ACP synthase II [Alphaproteobacteria bacterium]|nr:beta-ketoacyl-ACP synthase II [Alphaproteobacteria bacterium]